MIAHLAAAAIAAFVAAPATDIDCCGVLVQCVCVRLFYVHNKRAGDVSAVL